MPGCRLAEGAGCISQEPLCNAGMVKGMTAAQFSHWAGGLSGSLVWRTSYVAELSKTTGLAQHLKANRAILCWVLCGSQSFCSTPHVATVRRHGAGLEAFGFDFASLIGLCFTFRAVLSPLHRFGPRCGKSSDTIHPQILIIHCCFIMVHHSPSSALNAKPEMLDTAAVAADKCVALQASIPSMP